MNNDPGPESQSLNRMHRISGAPVEVTTATEQSIAESLRGKDVAMPDEPPACPTGCCRRIKDQSARPLMPLYEARRICHAVTHYVFTVHMGHGDKNALPDLSSYNLLDMLEACALVRLNNGNGETGQVVPSDHMVAAVYVFMKFDGCGIDKKGTPLSSPICNDGKKALFLFDLTHENFQ